MKNGYGVFLFRFEMIKKIIFKIGQDVVVYIDALQ